MALPDAEEFPGTPQARQAGSARTGTHSAPSANSYSDPYSAYETNTLARANVPDTAKINLPVDSQTYISAQLVKQLSVARRTCVLVR
jgi:hypothetical protein